MKITLTGDSFITQPLPRADERLLAIKNLFDQSDVTITNLETTVHNFQVYPSAVSGGTWAASRPEVLADLKWLGFQLLATATNHSLDWSHNGLLETIQHLDDYSFKHAGSGKDLFEACKPAYFETENGRVALISVNSTGHDWHMAGKSRPGTIGRPGINLLRYSEKHYITKVQFETLKQVVASTAINHKRDLDIKEGFIKELQGEFNLGGHTFIVDDIEQGTQTFANQEDCMRIKKVIQEAKLQADIVILSHHAHEMKSNNKVLPADFIEEFARLAIDYGADVYVGHGPHILRGIEIYKEKPIFYSLGNFIFQNDLVERQPADFYHIYDLDSGANLDEALLIRSNNGTRGLGTVKKVFQSVIVELTFNQFKIEEIKLHPIQLGFESNRSSKGRPRFSSSDESEEIIDYLIDLSKTYKTSIINHGQYGQVKIKG